MTDQGYTVFWNKPDDLTGKDKLWHRHFPTHLGASVFAATLPPEFHARVYERAHTPDAERRTSLRDNTDVLNRRSLVELMLQHNITIPTRQFDNWRPTTPTSGQIEGVADGLTCIMTDGLLGYFLRADREPLYGHVAHFKWDTPVESMIPFYNEAGELRYFKSIKDQGAPSALHHTPQDPSISPDKVKKSRPKGKSKRQFIIENL